jgi:hypothetical protein
MLRARREYLLIVTDQSGALDRRTINTGRQAEVCLTKSSISNRRVDSDRFDGVSPTPMTAPGRDLCHFDPSVPTCRDYHLTYSPPCSRIVIPRDRKTSLDMTNSAHLSKFLPVQNG